MMRNDDWPRQPPVAGDEPTTLLGSLARQRATFAWKCSGVDPAGMRATVGASTMTLGGLVKHLAFIEDVAFTWRLRGGDLPALWPDADFDDADWAWRSAVHDAPDELLARWGAAVDRSRAAVTAALREGDLGQLVRAGDWDQAPSLRRLLVDVIEEYARHVGHADLLREAVDGLVGEDPPSLAGGS